MLNRVYVAILDVACVIAFVSDEMLPKAPLPNTSLAARLSHRAQSFTHGNGAREPCFDPTPPHGKVRIAGRQSPHCMNVLRQNNKCVNMKRISLMRSTSCFPQITDSVRQ